MLAISITLNVVIAAFCALGCFSDEYKDNFGERAGMIIVGLVCVVRAAMASEFQIAERSDVLLEIGLVIYGWGILCAKLRNRRKRLIGKRLES